MLARYIAFACFAAVSTTACHRLPADEAKLVGTWEYVTIDAVGHITLTAGHRVTLAFPRDDSPNAPFRATAWGHWRLDGNEFVYDISNKKIGLNEQETRIRFLEVGPDKIVTDGHSPWQRIR